MLGLISISKISIVTKLVSQCVHKVGVRYYLTTVVDVNSKLRFFFIVILVGSDSLILLFATRFCFN